MLGTIYAHPDHHVQYAYVCEHDDTLVGVLPLRDLVLARRQEMIDVVMIHDPVTLSDRSMTFSSSHTFPG